MRKSISAQSQASVPPAPGLIDTTALAESCLPLIIACSSNASYCFSAFASAGSISASNDGVLLGQFGHRRDVAGGGGELLVGLEQGVEHLELSG